MTLQSSKGSPSFAANDGSLSGSLTTTKAYWGVGGLTQPGTTSYGPYSWPYTAPAVFGGTNAATTLQVGKGNSALTVQNSEGARAPLSVSVSDTVKVGVENKKFLGVNYPDLTKPVYGTVTATADLPQAVALKGVNNNAATVQVGKKNAALTLQDGVSALPVSNDSLVAQFGEKNGALVSQQNGLNGQATIQLGDRNNAVTLQKNAPVSGTVNAAATIQAGSKNRAFTNQVANPLNAGLNGSLIAQFGNSNTAVAAQSTGLQPMIGALNTQATVQVGTGNYAVTAQNSATVTNTSVTAQFGSHNVAFTSQH